MKILYQSTSSNGHAALTTGHDLSLLIVMHGQWSYNNKLICNKNKCADRSAHKSGTVESLVIKQIDNNFVPGPGVKIHMFGGHFNVLAAF